MKGKWKRLLSLALVLVMVLGVLPMSTFAADSMGRVRMSANLQKADAAADHEKYASAVEEIQEAELDCDEDHDHKLHALQELPLATVVADKETTEMNAAEITSLPSVPNGHTFDMQTGDTWEGFAGSIPQWAATCRTCGGDLVVFTPDQRSHYENIHINSSDATIVGGLTYGFAGRTLASDPGWIYEAITMSFAAAKAGTATIALSYQIDFRSAFYEEYGSYSITGNCGDCGQPARVTAPSGKSTVTRTFTVNVTDPNPQPEVIGYSTLNITKKFEGIDAVPEDFSMSYSYVDAVTGETGTGTVTLTPAANDPLTLTGSVQLPAYANVDGYPMHTLTLKEHNPEVDQYDLVITANRGTVDQNARTITYTNVINAVQTDTRNTIITNTYTANAYSYTVAYYYDGVPGDAPEGAATGGRGQLGEVVTITPAETVEMEGENYILVSENHSLTITADEDSNIIKVYYEKDTNGDNIPDQYQTPVYFMVDGGAWEDGATDVKSLWVTLRDENGNLSSDGTYTLTEADVPQVGSRPLEGRAPHGWWDAIEGGPTELVDGPAGQVVRYWENIHFTFHYLDPISLAVTVEDRQEPYTGRQQFGWGADFDITIGAFPGTSFTAEHVSVSDWEIAAPELHPAERYHNVGDVVKIQYTPAAGTEIGEYTTDAYSYTVMRGEQDVTDLYNVTINPGKLTITAPPAPAKPALDDLSGVLVTVDCENDEHDETKALMATSVKTIGEVKGSAATGYTCVVTLDGNAYVPAHHTTQDETVTFTMKYVEGRWTVEANPVVHIQCAMVTVTFDANGGELSVASKTVIYDAPYGSLPVPTREGYAFSGWTWNGRTVTEETVVATAEDHTLVAAWTANAPKAPALTDLDDILAGLTIKLDCVNDRHNKTVERIDTSFQVGEVTGTPQDGYACNVAMQCAPYLDEYHALVETQPETVIIPLTWNGTAWTTAMTELTIYEECTHFDVTFVNGEEQTTVKVAKGETVEEPETPVNGDAAFLGWFTENDEKFSFSTPITGDLILTAKWEQKAPVYVNVYRDGDTSEPAVSVKLGDYAKGTLFSEILADAGYLENLDGLYTPNKAAAGYEWDKVWSHEASNLGKPIGEGKVNGWTNLCAMVYDVYHVNYHVMQNDQEVEGKTEIITKKTLDTYTLWSYEVPTGYTFDGWYQTIKDFGDTSKQVRTPLMLKKYELYADRKAMEYTVTFDANGGEPAPEAKTVIYGLPYGELPAVTRLHYDFGGWTLEDGAVVTAETAVQIQGDHTLTALWTVAKPANPIGTNTIRDLYKFHCTADESHEDQTWHWDSYVKYNKDSLTYDEARGVYTATVNITNVQTVLSFGVGCPDKVWGREHYHTDEEGKNVRTFTLHLVWDPDVTGLNSSKKETTGLWLPDGEQIVNVYCYTRPAAPSSATVERLSPMLWVHENKAWPEGPAGGSKQLSSKKLLPGTYTIGGMVQEGGSFYCEVTVTDLQPYVDAFNKQFTDAAYVLDEAHNKQAYSYVLKYTGSTTDYLQDGSGWKLDAAKSGMSNSEKLNGYSLWLHHVHELEHHEAVAVTCEEDGSSEYWYCAYCDKYYSDAACTVEIEKDSWIIPALGHDWQSIGKVDATCTTPEYTTYQCKNDPAHIKQEVSSEALGHDYETVVTAPTCTTGGYTTYTCKRCGETHIDDITQPTGHTWDEGEVVKGSLCTEDGVMEYTCTVCGEKKQENIGATGHTYVETKHEPTCTDCGWITHTCSVCGYTYDSDHVAALGHTYEEKVVEPTCTDAGYTEYTCSVCGDHYTDKIVQALGHDLKEEVVEPTCTTMGKTYHVCQREGCTYRVMIDATDALGHDWSTEWTIDVQPTCEEEGSKSHHCTRCDEKTDVTAIPALGHDWDEGKVTKAATCEEAGVKTFTCKNNSSHTYTEEIPALGHDYDEGKVTKAATCEEDGVWTYTCKNDASHTKTEPIPALGHAWDTGVVTTPATCGTAGVKTYTCQNDTSHTRTEVIPATGSHSWDNGKVTKYPTYTQEGEKVFTCVVCGVTKTVSVPKLFFIPTGTTTPVAMTPELNKADHVAYIIGYSDGTIRPNGTITRAEAATIFFRLMTDECRENYRATRNSFYDVATTDWFNTAVSTLENAGVIIDSDNGYFRPNEAITRAELAAMAAQFTDATVRGGSSFSDVSASYWAADEIALVEQMGWITGYPDGTFGPNKTITRAEAMAILNRMLERGTSAGNMLNGMRTWKDNKPSDWYYEIVQEATNSHSHTVTRGVETWTRLTADPDWTKYER